MEIRNLDESIQSYAVMLNRATWLAPERLDAQRSVWQRLAAAEEGDEVITLVDVDSALRALIDNRSRSVNEIVPYLVLGLAADEARQRAQRVRQIIWNIDTPDVYLADVHARLERLTREGKGTQASINAVVEAIRTDMMLAEVDDDQLVKVITATNAALKKYTQPSLTHGGE